MGTEKDDGLSRYSFTNIFFDSCFRHCDINEES